MVYIRNTSNNQALGIRGDEVIEAAFDPNDRKQVWRTREVGENGYMTFTNPASDEKVLTAISPDRLEAKGE